MIIRIAKDGRLKGLTGHRVSHQQSAEGGQSREVCCQRPRGNEEKGRKTMLSLRGKRLKSKQFLVE